MRLIYEMAELGINTIEIYIVIRYLLSYNLKEPKNFLLPILIAELGLIILYPFSNSLWQNIYLLITPSIICFISVIDRKKSHIFYNILCIILIVTIEDLLLNTIRIGCKIINQNCNSIVAGSLVLLITLILWLTIIYFINRKHTKFLFKRKKTFFAFIAFAAIINAGVYSVLIYCINYIHFKLYNQVTLIECFLFLFGIILIAEIIYIIFLYFEKTHYSVINNFTNGYLEIEHEQIKQARSQDKSARIFRHNVREHFNLINYYAERGEMDELLSYLYSLGENVSTLKCKHQTGRDSVDGLIAFENDRLEQYNIKLEVDGALTEFGALSDYELCTLFSNAFQNAIEACIKVPDPTNRRISIHFRSNPPYKILEISNTVKENLKLSDTPLVTTKPDKENHGLGLMQIKQITHSHNGEVIINCTDNVFTLTLELKI